VANDPGDSEFGISGFHGRGTLVERNRDPRFPERISTIDLVETRVTKQGSQWSSAHRRLGTSGAKSLVHEVASSDLPRGSGSLIIEGIRGARSQGVGIRHFMVLAYNGITAGRTAIS
jgi:hypothetical protein